ncbi:MAG: glucosamine-6-phosphate deaminase [Candidatus Omnitrophota bacterium]
MRNYNYTSILEKEILKKFNQVSICWPTEKIQLLELPNFPSLGRFTALRFIEWLQLNPEGVISLPTGKTPEYFIKWAGYYLANWKDAAVAKELSGWGLNPDNKPRMDSFTFVQIDEFYPMNPANKNSFASYIDHFYFRQFGIDRKKSLLMDTWKVGAPEGKDLGRVFPDDKVDLSLRYRAPASELEVLQAQAITATDQAAMEYEARIEKLGGIGFFLGGIGPDGHIGFNIRGTSHFSRTVLAPINYETAAAAASDLGGVEIARQKVVLTIGLKTIAQNPTATVIIIAAGAGKAMRVQEAVENAPSVLSPATALQSIQGARFYLTKGAATLLTARRYQRLKQAAVIPGQEAEKILIDTAIRRNKHLKSLSAKDMASSPLSQLVLSRTKNLRRLTHETETSLKKRVTLGMRPVENAVILHTAPHHDDIMLGYLPYIIRLAVSPKNSHYFTILTSGFTSVTNTYTLSLIKKLEASLKNGAFTDLLKKEYFSPRSMTCRNRDIYRYLDGVAANSPEMQQEAEARRLLRNLLELTGKEGLAAVKPEITGIKNYLLQAYPGKKDPALIQKLKGTVREWEEELLWGHLGFNCDRVFHLRLGFYTGDIFTPKPELERDIRPVLRLLKKVNPDIVTVALDPEGSGPDTHYKILQVISEALKIYLAQRPNKKLRVWGYRNVWHKFHPSEANLFVPVSMTSLALMKSAFMTCFGSQRSASFPSHEYDGPFCDLACKIWTDQYTAIKTCLGREFFYGSPNLRLRAARGLNFLRSMTPEEFFAEARSLKELTE